VNARAAVHRHRLVAERAVERCLIKGGARGAILGVQRYVVGADRGDRFRRGTLLCEGGPGEQAPGQKQSVKPGRNA
jgi:hypothetical protein